MAAQRGLAARLTEQERITAALRVKVERWERDIKDSFREQTDYQIGLEERFSERFNQLDERLNELATQIGGVTAQVEASEGRILAAFNNLLQVLEARKNEQE